MASEKTLRDRLETIEWGQRHFGSLATGKGFPRREMLQLVEDGYAESIGVCEMCDDDGFIIVPQRLGEGFILTDKGRHYLNPNPEPISDPGLEAAWQEFISIKPSGK